MSYFLVSISPAAPTTKGPRHTGDPARGHGTRLILYLTRFIRQTCVLAHRKFSLIGPLWSKFEGRSCNDPGTQLPIRSSELSVWLRGFGNPVHCPRHTADPVHEEIHPPGLCSGPQQILADIPPLATAQRMILQRPRHTAAQ